MNIAPRLSSSTIAAIAGDAVAGTQVIDLSTLLWSAYPSNTVSYSLLSTVQTAEGVTALSIDSSTGVVSVATPSPAWNYNTKRVFLFNAQVTDSVTTRVSSAQFTVSLNHVNRQPVVSNVPGVFSITAGASGNVIGFSTYVSDEDLTLSPPITGEKFLYSLAPSLPSGNPSNTFAINATTGQIYVLNVTAFRSAYHCDRRPQLQSLYLRV